MAFRLALSYQEHKANLFVGFVCVLLVLALTGCGETPSPDVQAAVTTSTPVLTSTALPTETATAIPTQTPTQTPTSTPAATSTPSPTVTPTSTPQPSLLVRVLDADSGAPVPGAVVHLGEEQVRPTDADGQVRFAGLDEGAYTLAVEADGYFFESIEVTLAASENQHEVALVVRVVARITVESGNLRQGPGTVYAWQGSVQQGDQFEVVGSSEDGGWLVVVTGEGIRAWLWSALCEVEGSLQRVEVVPAPPTPTPAPTPTPVPTPTPALAQPGVYTFEDACVTYKPLDWDPATVRWCVESIEIPEQGDMLFIVAWHLDTRFSHGQIIKESDEGNTWMYLTDNLGNRYDHVAVGGAARDQTTVGFPGTTLRGEFWFPLPKPGAVEFVFHDDNQCLREQPCLIEGLRLEMPSP